MLGVGSDTVSAKATPSRFAGRVQVSFNLVRPGGITYGLPSLITVGSSVDVVVITDPVKHLVEVTMRGITFLSTTVDKVRPVSVLTGATHPAPLPALTAADVTASSPQPRLCQSLSG